MSVYTKNGDKGRTSLYEGRIVSKASSRVDTYGTLDELNSFLGLSTSFLTDKKIKGKIQKIQNDLFEIGTSLATPNARKFENLSKHLNTRVKEFENEIDLLTKKLPELENFILPGGGKAGSYLHISRTLTRRAERKVVALSDKEKVNPDILIYLNRLSDLLFMYARFINKKENKKEIIWSSRS